MISKFKKLKFLKSMLARLSYILILSVSSTALAKSPENYQEARDLYYQQLTNYALSNTDKIGKWQSVYQFLQTQPNFNLMTLTLYQLSSTSAASRDMEAYQKWLTELQQLNNDSPNLIVDYLISKLALDKFMSEYEHQKAINLGIELLEKSSTMTINNEQVQKQGTLSLTSAVVIDITNNIGKAYYLTGEYIKAQENFLNALEIAESVNARNEVSHLYNNLSVIAWAQKDIPKALEYLDKGLEISIELGDVKSIISKLSNKGLYHTHLSQMDQAKSSFEQVLAHEKIADYPKLKINTLLALSEIYSDIPEYEKSEDLIQQALAFAKSINDPFSIANAKMALAEIRISTKSYSDAIPLYLSALEFYQEKNLKKEQSTVLKFLSQCYQMLGDYVKAVEVYQNFHKLNIELLQEARNKSVTELQAKFDSDNRTKEIELLRQENKLKALEVDSINTQNLNLKLYGVGVFIILLLIISRYFMAHEAKRLKKYTNSIQDREKELLLLSNAFKGTSDGVWITDENFVIQVVNDAFVKLTGRVEPVGRKMAFAKVEGQDQEMTEAVLQQIQKEGLWEGEVFDMNASGRIYPIEIKIQSIKDDSGKIIHYLGAFRDITNRRKVQDTLVKLATQDKLTGLPNRTLLIELIERTFTNVESDQSTSVLLFVDIDGFKKLNDSFGHEIGDQFICAIANRLVSTLEKKHVVARIGGDEFAVLVELDGQKIEAGTIANKVLSVFELPFDVEGRILKITASIGVAVYPDDAANSEDLIRKSDIAMNVAKNAGKNTFSFYKRHMNDEVIALLEKEQHLVHAISQNYFEFFYQPIVNVENDAIVGAEALIRWREPNGKIIFPDDFIPMAERSALIEEIDAIVIDKVFAQVRDWQKNNLNLKHVSINLSARIFSQSDKLFGLLEDNLDTYNIAPSKIKIEITEGMLIDNIEEVIKTMHRLKSLGFILAIDDFGTGFSSLNYLKQFPIDVLKIDRSFIMDMHHSYKNLSIVRSIVDLAHNLGFRVIAEGVELLEHVKELQGLECEEYQGYYFSKPLEVTQFEAFFRSKIK